MSDEKQLVVVEQKEIDFYGDEIAAVQVEDGTVYVPVRPICDQIGVAWAAQRLRINRDAVLSKHLMSVIVTNTDIEPGSRRPHTSEMSALPLRYLNGWLFGINAGRVKPEIRERLIRYQEDCYQVLYEAFGRNEVTAAPDPLLDELLGSDNPTAIAYRQAMAIANMARQQLAIEARLLTSEGRLDDHETRLQIIEANRGDDSRYITNAQAVQIAQAVKQIALELGSRSKRNEFGGVYGELHRQFDVPSYKQLPAARFAEAINFLRQWWESLVGGNVPF